jgi:translation initiation factor IF-1
MSVYVFSLYLGALGLLVMAVSGFAHAGHGHNHGQNHGHTGGRDAGDVSLGSHGHAPALGHAHAGHAHAGHAHAGHGQAGHAHAGHGHANAAGRLLVNLLSPRVIFSLLVGFGATGLLLRPWLGGLLLMAAAVLGGVLFEAALVAPLWRFLFRFASSPAQSLESVLMDTAQAASGFDTAGCGLVAVELDGRIIQLLGTLRREDRQRGVRVRAGDRVRIEDVDAARNRCTVSYLGR